jgi:hypothetical protein
MTDIRDTDLDLSVLAKVTPPERDEKPHTTGGVPPGRPSDESVPPRTRRRAPRHRAAPPPDPEPPESKSREYVRDDELYIPDYKPGMFVKPITEAYVMLGMTIAPLSQPIGQSIMQNAEPCAKAWDNAAKIDKTIRKHLLKAMGAGALVPLLIAHMPIATVVFVVLFPGKPLPEKVELPDQPGPVVNPVSNGFERRPR